MTNEHDLGRILDRWFADGPDQAPDRILDAVADRIERQPQRHAWRIPKESHVNRYLKPLLAVAAVVVIAVIGYNLLPDQGGVGNPPSALPSSPGPTATLVPDLPDGTLKGGTYRLRPFASVPTLSIDAEVPDGWEGVLGWALIGPGPGGTEGPGGIGIAFLKADGLFSDPCHWDVAGTGYLGQPGDVAVGPTVDDLIAALAASSAYGSTTPTDVTLGGFRGKQLDLQVPTDLAACDTESDGSEGVYLVLSGPEAALYAQGPDNRWNISIVDVGGTRLIAVVASYAATPAADLAAAQAILDSLAITP